MAKVPSLNHPPTYNYLAQQTFYQGAIKPLLGGHAIHQELVVLRNSGIVKELNKFLLENDHLRKDKFKGTFIGRADWGFLVEDMRPRGKHRPPPVKHLSPPCHPHAYALARSRRVRPRRV